MKSKLWLIAGLSALAWSGAGSAAESPARITIISDAFGAPSALKRGWGYAAFVEYAGKRILFDTGGSLNGFAANVDALRIDLSRLDFVVLTHRHGDHTAGLHHVLTANPSVRIYTPMEGGYFASPLSPALAQHIKRSAAAVPADLRYFDGRYPESLAAESAWPGAHFSQITGPIEVAPGFWLFSVRSEMPGTREMNEIALGIRTPQGLALLVGCSHPGIEKMLEAAARIEPRIFNVYGGFHLVDVADAEVISLTLRLRDQWKLVRLAAGHCTGEFAFAEFDRVFGPRFDHAGVGAVLALPTLD
jgi:7,8-dihydropterin-6-yl-methyl-4-(beta-D-ribofuranosyl)aminobenzene 5'-phosphate synthase